jgi:hypothetical protein
VRPPFALVLGALVALAAPRAAAQEPSDDALIAEGVELRRSGHDEEALASFRRAYALRPTLRALGQIALAEQALGRWLDAEDDLQRALAADQDAWIARHRDVLEGALAIVRSHVGRVEVESPAPGAELSINGAPAGPVPRDAVRVVAGPVVLVVTAPGYLPLRRSLDVAGGARVKARFDLLPAPPPEPQSPQAAPLVAPAPATSSSTASLPRTLAWATLFTGGAFVAGGVVANVVRENDVAIYNDPTRCWYGGLTRDELCLSKRQAADTAQSFAIAGYVAGGALLATSAVLFLTTRPRESRAAAVGCGPSGAGVRCEGTF